MTCFLILGMDVLSFALAKFISITLSPKASYISSVELIPLLKEEDLEKLGVSHVKSPSVS